jgi:polyribonucleotide nucleotidyltransferase
MAIVLSADQENDPDVLAMIGASAALTISRIPFLGPIGACRLGRVDGQFVVNPTYTQLESSDLSLLLGGRKDALNMIEVSAKELPENVIADAVASAHKVVAEVCELIEQLREKAGVEKECPLIELDEKLCSQIRSQVADKLYELKQIPTKRPRQVGVNELFEQIYQQYCPISSVAGVDSAPKFDKIMVKRVLEKIEGEVVRKMVLEGRRCDGRRHDELRPISCVVGILPRNHGSALFRIVSDITESNGSSSMASVCGGTLALLDAGVPIKRPVAGISIGMVSDETGRYELLTDITGDEDHFGDMDFKVAGTVGGITAIQLDIKAEGLPYNIMVEALERAKVAWLKILEIMAGTISGPRPELSVYAPKLTTLEIDPSLIGKVIGPGGKMIKSIQEQTGATIEVEEDGTIYISCWGGDGHLKAKDMIESLTQPPQVGRIYDQSKVVSVKDFGVFVEISPGVEGLCHISELSDGFVRNAEDVCKVGDLIPVKLLAIDDQGRFKLSRKAALAEMNKEKATDGQHAGERK